MNERYELLEKIAQGGRSTVWRALDQNTGRMVALKQFIPQVSVVEIQREAFALKATQHPNIVTLLESNEHSGFLVLEHLEGPTLEAIAPLSLTDFQSLARQTLAALQAVHHAGWLHRDVKPENLMLSADGDCKLIDFGLACRIGERIENAMTGSVFFMAPEQFGNGQLDVRADVYALGCTFYFALTGQLPFQGETTPQVISSHLYEKPRPLREQRTDIPERVIQIIKQMMARHPNARPAGTSDIDI